MLHVVSVRTGTKYSADYVAVLYDMVSRNLSLSDFCFWCVTDDPASLPDGVNAIAHDPALPGWWQKVGLFRPDMPFAQGDRIVYLDLDIAITGRLEDLAETKGIISDWLWPCYNSSVMVWDHGEHAEIWSKFTPAIIDEPGSIVPRECLPVGQTNGGDQEWITAVSTWPTLPRAWCLNYRQHALEWPPSGSKVVSFNGALKPHQVESGWVTDIWKVGGFTSLPKLDGMNVTYELAYANVRANSARDLPWFTGFKGSNDRDVVIVAGGPSMADRVDDIRQRKRRGARIVTVNNALSYLMQRGIKPDVHVMLDARPENVDFVKDAPEGVRYLIASQCDPGVFDALAGRDVHVWHNAFGDGEDLREILDPWWDAKPVCMVPGGGTVGLRAIWLCCFSGYKHVHVYGMDSSYGAGRHHAYPQALNDGEAVQSIAMGSKVYRCAPWMVRQAEEFKMTWGDMAQRGVTISVHGRGLIPDISRILVGQQRQAA